jgi:lipid-binding SYLF domain-containing protein
MRTHSFFTKSLLSKAAVCLVAATFSVAAVAGERQETRITHATRVLDELMKMPEQNIPTWLLERAHAVAVIPAVIKVGLGIGGRRGKGVLVVRKDNGQWSNPVFVNLTGGSFGFQVGVQSTDIVLVFTSRQSIEGIVGGKVTLGADASVAAGPVGRQSSAATDVGLTAQVYSYSRAQGLFAGVALDGSAHHDCRGGARVVVLFDLATVAAAVGKDLPAGRSAPGRRTAGVTERPASAGRGESRGGSVGERRC